MLVCDLSLFTLSLFRIATARSHPLVLKVLTDGTTSVTTRCQVVRIVPLFVVIIKNALAKVFLPGDSRLVTRGGRSRVRGFTCGKAAVAAVLTGVLYVPFVLKTGRVVSTCIKVRCRCLCV